jgi:hypothetical protein
MKMPGKIIEVLIYIFLPIHNKDSKQPFSSIDKKITIRAGEMNISITRAV